MLCFDKRRGIAQIPIMIALMIMAVAIPVASNLVKQKQDTRSSATESDCSHQGDKCCFAQRWYCNVGYCYEEKVNNENWCIVPDFGSDQIPCNEESDTCCYLNGFHCADGFDCEWVSSNNPAIEKAPYCFAVAEKNYYYSCKTTGTCDITSNKYETLAMCTANLEKYCKVKGSPSCKCYPKDESGMSQCSSSCKVGDVPSEPILPVEPIDPPEPPKSCVTMTGKTVPHKGLACGTDGDNMIYICSDGAWYTHKNCLAYGQICDQGSAWAATCIANTTPRKLYKCNRKVGTKCTQTDTTYTSVADCDASLAKWNCVAPECKCYEATNTEACDTACAGSSTTPKGCTNLENGVSVPYANDQTRCSGNEIVVCKNGAWISKNINCADLGQVCKLGKCEAKPVVTNYYYCLKSTTGATWTLGGTSNAACLSAQAYEKSRGNTDGTCTTGVTATTSCSSAKLKPMYYCNGSTCSRTGEDHFSKETCQIKADYFGNKITCSDKSDCGGCATTPTFRFCMKTSIGITLVDSGKKDETECKNYSMTYQNPATGLVEYNRGNVSGDFCTTNPSFDCSTKITQMYICGTEKCDPTNEKHFSTTSCAKKASGLTCYADSVCSNQCKIKCPQCTSDAFAKGRGDANCDGKVTMSDFEVWRREKYDTNSSSFVWTADFNCIESVGLSKPDIQDYYVWSKTYYGK